jgi:hypothetical protein
MSVLQAVYSVFLSWTFECLCNITSELHGWIRGQNVCLFVACEQLKWHYATQYENNFYNSI